MRYGATNRRGTTRADLVAAVLLLAGGGVLWTLDPDGQLAVARGLRDTVLYPFLAVHEAFAERARVAGRLAELRQERDSLVREALALHALAGDALRLRELLGVGPPPEGSLVPADLVPGRPRVGDSDVFMLRGPGLEGVEAPAAVLAGNGLLGVLRATRGGGGKGEFWTHPDFRVSVRTGDGATTGIVRAVRDGDGQPVMLLEGAPYQAEIASGTELFTTGLGGIYPPGLKVGTVDSVSAVESGWARSYYVRPAVRPEEAGAVLVWRRPDETP